MIDQTGKKIYVFDEMYQKGMSNEAIYSEVLRMGYAKEKITADCAEPNPLRVCMIWAFTVFRRREKVRTA
jgi:phage terminase large subunit